MSSALEPESADRPVRIRELLTVIPARNEQERLPRALAALERAREHLASNLERAPRVRVIVVLDRCTDDSVQVVRRWRSVESLVIDDGNVGVARARGIDLGLARSGEDPRHVWITCTDADSAVPSDWLTMHLEQARAGADLLLGTVRPDPDDVPEQTMVRWVGQHRLGDGHPHVHGANLGVRADWYRRAGGFAPVRTHEDRLLVEAVRNRGGRVISTASSPVVTSGRLMGRAPGGFARYMRELGRQEDGRTPSIAAKNAG